MVNEIEKEISNQNQDQEEMKKDWKLIHEDFGWKGQGFTVEETKKWIEVGFEPHELDDVKKWINCEFSPEETKELVKDLKTHEAHLASWCRTNKHSVTKDNLEQLRTDYKTLARNKPQAWLEQIYPKNAKEIDIKWLDRVDDQSNRLDEVKLTGKLNFSNYHQLEKLNCSDNQLTNLNLSGCRQLQEIDCSWNKLSWNKLTTITYPERLEYLTKLNISENRFSQEPTFLTRMPNLEVLSIRGYHSHFTNLTAYLKYCPKLKKLDARNSNLPGGSLTIQDLPDLVEIDLSNGRLTNLKINNCEKITKLDIGFNYSLSQTLDYFTPLVNLEELDIGRTKFHGSLAPLAGCSKLKELDIRNTDIDGGLEYLPDSLQEFNCSANQRKDAKCKILHQELSKYNDFQSWKKVRKEQWEKDIKNFSTRPQEIRKNIHQFFNSYSNKEIVKLKDPDQLGKWGYAITAGQWIGRGTSAAGGVLVIKGAGDYGNNNTINGGILAVIGPFVEAGASYYEKKFYEANESKWDRFIVDSKQLWNDYQELKDILICFEAFCISSAEKELFGETRELENKIKELEEKELAKHKEELKTNRTPEEESELERLRKKLKELEQNTENKPFNYLPWIIGGSVLVVGIIISVLIFNKNKKRSY